MTRKIETLRWVGDERGHLVVVDQTCLPIDLVEHECHDVEATWEAIKQLRVRGAPAIGIAAAYGVVLGLQKRGFRSAQAYAGAMPGAMYNAFLEDLNEVASYLATSRPTAVNLFWALDR